TTAVVHTSPSYHTDPFSCTLMFSRKRRDPNPRDALAPYTLSRGASSANLSTFPMAPQVRLEPTTDRLTADSSTNELLCINSISNQAQILLYQLIADFQEISQKNMQNIYTKLI